MKIVQELKDRGIAPAGNDAVLPYAVEPLDVRGRAVFLGPSLDRMLDRHDYPVSVSRLLAEAVTLVTLLGTSLKFDGRFTLQTQTDGPVSMLVVDFETPDGLRACAKFDADAVAAAEREGRSDAPSLLGKGHLAMTVDQGANMQLYQGIVELNGIGLEEVAHRYFLQSEQIPTVVRLAVAEILDRQEGSAPKHRWRAGGVLAQFLPEAPERMRVPDLHPGDAPDGADIHEVDEDDAWVEARTLVETLKDEELTDPELTVEQILFRLFHERGVRIFTPQAVEDRCRCSRERVEGMLRSFTEEEIRDMTKEENRIEVTCEFCSSQYDFDAGNILADVN
ncbi:Hsp33 family molecular chaperone [Rhizobiales bacterium]|uniref:Hsp33 family molecular chaperone n=1 Tax=Hongsoonwoonella zoysiae TaxID=2821844 RepID=UPI00156139C7|nr:Hsp33 family molecular chaperone [Hongsoonwoonella zoysiae]NRG19654.1 Hsp33 family molecular chaperone [Hongsoonwoonella zoysiae]